MRTLVAALLCCACGTTGLSDSGTDGGLDAGPVCTGPSDLLASAQCEPLTSPWTDQCRATRALTLAAHPADCDAGAGFVGHVEVADNCLGLDTATWTYGFPGDSETCFYATDGGALVGVLVNSDHGTLVSGHVERCPGQVPSSCRDGG